MSAMDIGALILMSALAAPLIGFGIAIVIDTWRNR